MYADDTTVVDWGVSIEDTQSKTQMSIKQAEGWCVANFLKLNKEKTQQFLFDLKSKSGLRVKLLGVHLDSSLTWCYQELNKKLNVVVFQLRKIIKITNFQTAVTLYYSSFQNLVQYSVALWGSSSSARRIFVTQKKAIRILAEVDGRAHCRPLFIKLGILTLPSLYIYIHVYFT
jgi:hypothetical protein